MDVTGLVGAYWRPLPRCPVHGQMQYLDTESRWTCAGFDGEGCDHTVTDEELAWQPLGQVDAEDLARIIRRVI
jgi:hypothetical protein